MQPSSRGEAITLLAACLALVRPVGMSEAEAEDWLSVAAVSVEHLPIDILDAACLIARRTCTHHAQVVPAIIGEGQPRLDERRRLAAAEIPALALPAPARRAAPPLSQSEVDAMARASGDLPRALVRLGLKCGALIETEDGRILLAPGEDPSRD